ncbi:MAG: glutamate synthase central domain-containing protein, partial [bacterium]
MQEQPISASPDENLMTPFDAGKDSCGVGFVAHMKNKKSHEIVEQGIEILYNLSHRGACGCETNTGDGAGILIQIPDKFFRKNAVGLTEKLPPEGRYGVGAVFLPKNHEQMKACEDMLDKVVQEEGQILLGWRVTPTDNTELGQTARASEPIMKHVFIGQSADMKDQDAFERKLFLIRKRIENQVAASTLSEKGLFYLASLSSRTIVYKGMLTPGQVHPYFRDLRDKDTESALALVHSRFSTNTFPSWDLAHPFRYIAHNGEINTLRGNINWMHAREALFETPYFSKEEVGKLLPIIREGQSDSAAFDNALEILVMAGRSLPHSMMMLVPEAWTGHATMPQYKKDFYHYHACLMEPWDGPASIAFTDGQMIGALLDRNGLRPSRYYVTQDDLVVMASEVGVLDIDPEKIIKKGRLEPGKMFLINLIEGRIVDDAEIKEKIAAENPYGDWLKNNLTMLDQLPEAPHVPEPDHETVLKRQKAYGYTHEELKLLMAPMAMNGEEAIGSMGDDTPIGILSNFNQPLFNYFKQLFAQVTNPPLDAIREELVTSVNTTLGPEGNLLMPKPESCRQIELSSPVLDNDELAKFTHIQHKGFKSLTIPVLYRVAEGGEGLAKAIEEIRRKASQAVKDGYQILILSDRGLDHDWAPIPSLLVTAGVHHHLIRQGERTKVGLIIESGEPREVHHFGLLLGYGANAINPYLAFESLDDMIRRKVLPSDIDHKTAVKKYIKAANKGIVKIMSKMGI